MSSNSNVSGWIASIIKPSDNQTRAPASTPYLCSMARFVRSFDIHYDAAVEGKFHVIASPDPSAAYARNGVTTTQPASQQSVSLTSQSKSESSGAHAGFFTQTAILIHEHDKALVKATTAGALIGTNDTTPCYGVNVAANTNFSVGFSRKVPGYMVFVGYFSDQSSQNLLVSKDLNATANLNIAKHLVGLTIYEKTLSGSSITSWHTEVNWYMHAEAGRASAPDPMLMSPLVRSELLDQGKVETYRCTGLEMLVTNMAAPLYSGGELVMARCRSAVLSNEGDLASIIKQLPEQRYWRSGSVEKGGWAFWLPDDIASYEPTSLGSTPSDDNVLVATGALSEGGYIRIMITWLYEFYTPSQVFQREYSPAFTDEYRLAWKDLSSREAVSENFSHEALAAMLIAQAVKAVYQYVRKGTKQNNVRKNTKKQPLKSASKPIANPPKAPRNKGAQKKGQNSGVQPGTKSK